MNITISWKDHACHTEPESPSPLMVEKKSKLSNLDTKIWIRFREQSRCQLLPLKWCIVKIFLIEWRSRYLNFRKPRVRILSQSCVASQFCFGRYERCNYKQSKEWKRTASSQVINFLFKSGSIITFFFWTDVGLLKYIFQSWLKIYCEGVYLGNAVLAF